MRSGGVVNCVGVSREDAFCQSMSVVNVNHISSFTSTSVTIIINAFSASR